MIKDGLTTITIRSGRPREGEHVMEKVVKTIKKTFVSVKFVKKNYRNIQIQRKSLILGNWINLVKNFYEICRWIFLPRSSLKWPTALLLKLNYCFDLIKTQIFIHDVFPWNQFSDLFPMNVFHGGNVYCWTVFERRYDDSSPLRPWPKHD